MNRRKSLALLSALAAAIAVGTVSTRPTPPPFVGWNLIGWNDLGMHCMDADYSVFSILPPFNTVHAQLVDANGDLVTAAPGIQVTYEAVADPSGSINKSSVGKTNYWQFATALYGASSTPDTGLAGHDMPGPANTPQPMRFEPATAEWIAEGVPLTPYDDAGRKRTYPLMRLVARSAGGGVLATTDVVLPVSDEMDCSLCHASDSAAAAMPAAGWVHDPNFERDYRLNLLRLHDERQAGNATFASALTTAGYAAGGLEATVAGGTPILCARCHGSNALPGTGLAGITPLTEAMHAGHAMVLDPVNGMTLDSSSNRAACYRCHPGSDTRCLRGAMGSAVAADATLSIQCQSCHGSMSAVGASGRVGWLAQPNCQNCHTGTATHNNGQIRYDSAFTANGQPRVAVDATFATDADAPAPGFSLYRFSYGHGGLACEACHGSTHAVFPAAHGNDNLQNEDLQGHAGTLVECTACHQSVSSMTTGGPHGMHAIGAGWIADHHDVVEHGGLAQCQACHGTDSRGTVLSRSQGDRTYPTRYGTKNYWRGYQISCYSCHNGPNSENASTNRDPIVVDTTATTTDQPVTIALTASDPDANPLTLRVVKQPAHGTVGIVGTVATYRPEPGFAGEDLFTFAAWDGKVDSNLGTVRVTRLATAASFGIGYPGTGGVVPALVATTTPALGSTLGVDLQCSAGVPTVFGLVTAPESTRRATGFGGVLLVDSVQGLFGPMPAAGLHLNWPVPNNPALVGANLYAQSLQLDPGARFGVAFSRGLRLTLGH